VRSTTARIVPLSKGVLGLVNFATTPCLLAPITGVQTLPLSVVDALVMTSAVLGGDATRELVLPARETEIATTIPTAVAAFPMRTACGIPILSLTANPKSNVTSPSADWLWALQRRRHHLQPHA